MSERLREYRGAKMNVGMLYDLLGNPTAAVMARRLRFEPGQKQQFAVYKARGILPWAVYLALLDTFGRPKFLEEPQQVLVRQPYRLPKGLAKYIDAASLEDLAPAVPAPAGKAPEPPAVEEVPAPTTAPSPVVVRVEVVPQAPEDVLRRLEALEKAVGDLRALLRAPREPPQGSHEFSRGERRLLKQVAEKDPRLARTLASSL